jgi:hypothetical protein
VVLRAGREAAWRRTTAGGNGKMHRRDAESAETAEDAENGENKVYSSAGRALHTAANSSERRESGSGNR